MVLNLQLLQWLLLFILVWVISLTVLLVQTILHYRKLTNHITKKDLKTVLTDILNRTDGNQKQIKDLTSALNQLQLKSKSYIQKVGFIRFNPFPQTGGDQSFCLSLLDEKNTGFVLSSLHSRDTTRFYAKTITNGKPDGYELSQEELKAIKNAR